MMCLWEMMENGKHVQKFLSKSFVFLTQTLWSLYMWSCFGHYYMIFFFSWKVKDARLWHRRRIELYHKEKVERKLYIIIEWSRGIGWNHSLLSHRVLLSTIVCWSLQWKREGEDFRLIIFCSSNTNLLPSVVVVPISSLPMTPLFPKKKNVFSDCTKPNRAAFSNSPTLKPIFQKCAFSAKPVFV